MSFQSYDSSHSLDFRFLHDYKFRIYALGGVLFLKEKRKLKSSTLNSSYFSKGAPQHAPPPPTSLQKACMFMADMPSLQSCSFLFLHLIPPSWMVLFSSLTTSMFLWQHNTFPMMTMACTFSLETLSLFFLIWRGQFLPVLITLKSYNSQIIITPCLSFIAVFLQTFIVYFVFSLNIYLLLSVNHNYYKSCEKLSYICWLTHAGNVSRVNRVNSGSVTKVTDYMNQEYSAGWELKKGCCPYLLLPEQPEGAGRHKRSLS